MADNQNFKCTGDCLKCLPAQRAYCAAQHAYSNMKVLDMVMAELLAMKGSVEAISQKIDDMQHSEDDIFDPTITQKGDGVVE